MQTSNFSRQSSPRFGALDEDSSRGKIKKTASQGGQMARRVGAGARDQFMSYSGIRQAIEEARDINRLLEIDTDALEKELGPNPLKDLKIDMQEFVSAYLSNSAEPGMPFAHIEDPDVRAAEWKALVDDLKLYMYKQSPHRQILYHELATGPMAQEILVTGIFSPDTVEALGKDNCLKLIRKVQSDKASRKLLLSQNLPAFIEHLEKEPELADAAGKMKSNLLPQWQTQQTKLSQMIKGMINPQDALDEAELAQINQEAIEKAFKKLEALESLGPDVQKQFKSFLFDYAVVPGKLAQIFGNDDKVLSENTPTRTHAQAQRYIDSFAELAGRYEIIPDYQPNVGTVGEMFQARRLADGQVFAVKLLKDGLSEDVLELESRIIQRLLTGMYADPDKLLFQQHQVDSLYQAVIHELNYSKEMQGVERLRNGTRYEVAQVVDMGRSRINREQGKVMISEWADGVQMSKLMKMIQAHEADPAKYAEDYKHEIARNPWLADPGQWKKKLPEVYLKAITEQTLLRQKLFARKTWTSTEGLRSLFRKETPLGIHGDPHAGNVFIRFDQKSNKLVPVFIDAGLTIERNSAMLLHNAGLALDMAVGNSRSMATRLVNTAERLPKGKPRRQVTDELARDLDKYIYARNGDHARKLDMDKVGKAMNLLLEKHQIQPDRDQYAFLKSQIQAGKLYRELCQTTGQSARGFLKTTWLDTVRGILCSVARHPVEAMRAIMPAIQHLLHYRYEALSVLFRQVA